MHAGKDKLTENRSTSCSICNGRCSSIYFIHLILQINLMCSMREVAVMIYSPLEIAFVEFSAIWLQLVLAVSWCWQWLCCTYLACCIRTLGIFNHTLLKHLVILNRLVNGLWNWLYRHQVRSVVWWIPLHIWFSRSFVTQWIWDSKAKLVWIVLSNLIVIGWNTCVSDRNV